MKGNKIKSNSSRSIVVCSIVVNNRKLGNISEQRRSEKELQKKEWERNYLFFQKQAKEEQTGTLTILSRVRVQ